MTGFLAELAKNFNMSDELHTFEHLEPIPPRYGNAIVVASVFFFQILNKVVIYIGPPKAALHTKPWKWKNLFISWIHALIVGTWDLICFYLYPELLDDLIAHHNFCTYSIVAFSTGYFVYDFFDVILEGRLFSSWDVVCHHIAVTGMFYYDVATCRCIGYTVVALMAEVNTFFLHSRKMMQLCQFDFNHWLYKSVVYVNLITLVLCRFCSLGTIIYGMIFYNHRVDLPYFCCLTVAILVMSGINIGLFYRLFKNDILRKAYKYKVVAKEVDKSKPTFLHTSANNNIKENGIVENGIKKDL